jgi:hypothetical protein
MEREIVWTPRLWAGSEHLHLSSAEDGVVADGMIIATEDGIPVRLNYQIICDDAWRTRRLTLTSYGRESLTLASDDDHRWYRGEDRATELPELAGCIDVDIALTPFTNTLPIRRLGLQPGEAADIRAVYVQPTPSLEIDTSEQRYTRLDPHAGAEYRYQSGSFTADLAVDSDGIVIDYPGLWTRSH